MLVDDKDLGGGLTSMSANPEIDTLSSLSDIDWSDFTEALRTALQAEPHQYLQVQAKCAERR